MLKDERIRQGKQLREFADNLRIGSRYLEAIEAEDWGQLPGGFFNRAFVRQYAAALGFDAAKIEKEFTAILKPEPVIDLEAIAEAHNPRARRSEAKKLISVDPLPRPGAKWFDSRTGLAAAALVLLVAGGGALSLLWDRVNARPGVSNQNTANTPPPVVPAPKPAVEAPKAEQAQVVPIITTDDAGNISLNIEATEKTWIEVSADGKRIFAGILEPGQTKTISSAQRTKMIVGNAAGIAVRKGGRDIGPIGPRGQVRTLNITADSVEIVPRARKTAI
jgi:cytoskeletal protein RodZ